VADKTSPATRRFPDLFTLLVGLISLGVAGAVLTGHDPLRAGFDLRWLLAGAAVLFGLLMLIGSLRRNGSQ